LSFQTKLLVLSHLQLELEHELIDLNQNKVIFLVNSLGLEKLKQTLPKSYQFNNIFSILLLFLIILAYLALFVNFRRN